MAISFLSHHALDPLTMILTFASNIGAADRKQGGASAITARMDEVAALHVWREALGLECDAHFIGEAAGVP